MAAQQEQTSALKIAPISELALARLLKCRSEADVDQLANSMDRSRLDLLLHWLRAREQLQETLCIECGLLQAAEGSARCYDCGAALRRRCYNGHGLEAEA